MNNLWFLIVVAAIFEVIWVTGLKHADHILEWMITMISIMISFGVLIYASKRLPASTVYSVFVGLGTAGTVMSEMVWFDEPFHWPKLGLIVLLLIGIIGLKAVTNEEQEGERKGGEPS